MNKQENILTNELENIFHNDAPPNSENILRNGSYESNIESGYVVNFFNGKKWTDVTLNKFINDYEGDPSACLLFMSPEAFRYYLPLYLRICLVDYDNADVIYDTTLWRLIPSKNNMNREEFDELFNGYNGDQKALIAKILQFLAQAHIDDFGEKSDAQTALDDYWKEFLLH